MSEALVAAFGFATWAQAYAMLDLLPCLQAFRFDGFESDAEPFHINIAVGFCIFVTLAPLVGCAALMLAVAAATALIGISAGTVVAMRRKPHLPHCVLKIYSVFFVYLAAIASLHVFKKPARADVGQITLWRLCAEVSFGIFAYDFLFFFVHLAMHQGWALRWLHGHGQHHKTVLPGGRLSPLDTVNHHMVDGGLQVFTNIVVQNLTLVAGPKHKLSRYAHNALVTFLLVESHAGYDAPWSLHRIWPRVYGGARRHHAHHQEGSPYLQQFFMYLDDIRGQAILWATGL